MNLINKYNVGAQEVDMQEFVAAYFSEQYFNEHKRRGGLGTRVYREVYIPEVRRRSDIIVRVTDRKIFNIECKINDINGVIAQAKSHLWWADYSYICAHARTYIPPYTINAMLNNGIGLMLWDDKVLVDVLGACQNTYKGGKKDAAIRQKVMDTLRKIDRRT